MSNVLTQAQSQAQGQAVVNMFGHVSPYLHLSLVHIAMQTQAQAQPQAQAQTQAQAQPQAQAQTQAQTQAQASQDTANATKNLIAGVSSLASLIRTALAPAGSATPANAVPTMQQQVSVLQCLKRRSVRAGHDEVLCSCLEVPLNRGPCGAVSQEVLPVD